jgi:hypothetical protein
LEYQLSFNELTEIILPQIEDKENDAAIVVNTVMVPYQARDQMVMYFNGQYDNLLSIKPLSPDFANKDGITYMTIVVTELLERPL